jgi:Cof subfamily protein (haloacid dehalogenase superfamily)
MDKVICTDLDGTLFYPRNRFRMVGKQNRSFIKHFYNDGGKVLLVSGRNRFMSEKVGQKLDHPFDYIACNGAAICSDGQLIREVSFDNQEVTNLVAEIRKQYNPPLIFLFTREDNFIMTRTDVSHWTNFVYALYELCQGTYREPHIRSDKVFAESLQKGHIYKVMVMFGVSKKKKHLAMEVNKEFRLRYPNAEFSWIGEFIEITPKGCSKKEGIEFYLDYHHIPRDNVLVVGDSGNDISMFEAWKENSFCMEHGPAEVKKHASHIIKRFYDLEDYLYPLEEK